MTDKELKKIKRAELLEMLLEARRENENLKQQLREADRKLNDRKIMLDKVGSIAEASLHINEVFETAQKAADQYLENVKRIAGAGQGGDDADVSKYS
jgi:cell division septum initiation protein DivIVA